MGEEWGWKEQSEEGGKRIREEFKSFVEKTYLKNKTYIGWLLFYF